MKLSLIIRLLVIAAASLLLTQCVKHDPREANNSPGRDGTSALTV